jgi:transposase
MAISPEITAQILRYYHVEKWPVGTIARQLQVHHGTVKRVLAQAGQIAAVTARRASAIDPYLTFIHETLQKFPTLSAARLYSMVRERGYRGGPDHFRHVVSLHRPRRHAEAFTRRTTLIGEEGQMDWGHFGKMEIGRAHRPLLGFAMVLSYSRQPYLQFFFDAQMENFLRGHVAAFASFGGVPRIILYDNLKSAVLERHGDAIRFNPALLTLASHYRFEPRPVAVARGNEKGRVERFIRYVRENFFAAREFKDLADLNEQARQWCLGQAADRLVPGMGKSRVHEVFAAEQARLLPLPEHPFPTDEMCEVSIGKTPYARFDLNDYSVPHTHVQRTLTVRASPDTVRIFDGVTELANHPRSYDKGTTIEAPVHIETLVKHKRKSRQHQGMNRLSQAAPASVALLTQVAARGDNMGTVTAALLRLLDRYGASQLQLAIETALASGVPHPNAVRLALERQREARNEPPPVVVSLPSHVQARDQPVQTQELAPYDKLKGEDHGQ